SFVLDKVFDGTLGADLKAAADARRVGVFGHSFGGYTTLMLAGGLQSAEGSLMPGDLADPRIGAMVEISGLDETIPATLLSPTLLLPKPNVEAIHVPAMVIYGEHETNIVGIDLTAEGQDFFNRLNPEKTGI